MKKLYLREKSELLRQNRLTEKTAFNEDLIKDLPLPLRKYLQICGYMNTPVPVNASIHWKECYFKMSPDKKWGKVTTLQFNSIKPIARIAHMKFSSMPISARDLYRDGYGEMKVKLFNLFRLAFENGKETAQSALITSFAEFLMLPGYFLLDNVQWETVNETTVRARLSDCDIEVSGLFYFNSEGLMNRFETEDRYYSYGKNTFGKVKYSAVVDTYKAQGELKIAEKVKAIWHLPEGDYEYFKGTIDRIDYNVS